MTADVKVHESISGRVQKGQRVRVICDTMPERPLNGTVMSVSVLAAAGSWRDPNRRDYTVRVLLDDTAGFELKPSMRCKAEIFLDRVTDAMSVPIQAVFRRGGRTFAYVPQGGGFAQREIEVGRASETRIEILSGLSEGEQVLVREPGDAEIVDRLPFVEAAGGSEFGGAGEIGAMSDDGPGGAGGDAMDGPRPGASGGAGRGGMNFDPAAMITQFDVSGDGALQIDEAPEQMQGFFDRMDADGDGSVTAEEAASMRRPGGGERGRGDDDAARDADQDGDDAGGGGDDSAQRQQS
jgi:hypothetical protein